MTHLLALLILLVSLAACVGYGCCWLRLLGMDPRREGGSPLRLFYAAALGMGTLGHLVLAAGLLGALHRGALGALVGVGWVLLLLCGPRPRRLPAGKPEEEGAARWGGLLLTGFCGLLALATLFSALKPVDGLDWDSLSYHLAAPKIYLAEGRISFIAYDSHTHFPFTMEMLYTLGLAFGGAPAAKLFHWAAGWLAAAAVGVWTARLDVGGRRCPAWTGPLAAAAYASMPIVLWEMGTAYVDLGTALFQFLALAALVDATGPFRDGEHAGKGGSLVPAAALAGLLSGFALGTKYTALLQFGLLGLGLLGLALRAGREGGPALRAAACFGAVGLAAAAPWYVKNWLWVHNPVHPFFYGLFPRTYSWTRAAAEAYAGEQASFGLGREPGQALKVFWNLSVHGRAFYINDRSLIGDRIGSLGPLWAGLLPLAAWARGLGRPARICLLYGLVSVALWFFLSQQARYLTPVFAPLAVTAAAAVAALPGAALRGAALLFAAAGLFLNLGMHAPLAVSAVQVVTGQVTEQAYLEQSLPGIYQASRYVNELPPESRVAFYQETRGYYMDRRYFWANPLQHNLIPYDRLRDGTELAEHLRRFGITHVLINYDFCRNVEGSTWYRLLMDAMRRGLLEERFRSPGARFPVRGVMVYALR